MNTLNRKQRQAARKRYKAKRARLLFREYVRNRKREWDAEVSAARDEAAYSRSEMNRVKRMFNQLVEQILAINPDFPHPGKQLRYAPDYIERSGLERMTPKQEWPGLAITSNKNWSEMSTPIISNWYTTIRFELDNDRMRGAKAFRLRASNYRISEAKECAVTISDVALMSNVTAEHLLEAAFVEITRGVLGAMRK